MPYPLLHSNVSLSRGKFSQIYLTLSETFYAATVLISIEVNIPTCPAMSNAHKFCFLYIYVCIYILYIIILYVFMYYIYDIDILYIYIYVYNFPQHSLCLLSANSFFHSTLFQRYDGILFQVWCSRKDTFVQVIQSMLQ